MLLLWHSPPYFPGYFETSYTPIPKYDDDEDEILLLWYQFVNYIGDK